MSSGGIHMWWSGGLFGDLGKTWAEICLDWETFCSPLVFSYPSLHMNVHRALASFPQSLDNSYSAPAEPVFIAFLSLGRLQLFPLLRLISSVVRIHPPFHSHSSLFPSFLPLLLSFRLCLYFQSQKIDVQDTWDKLLYCSSS